MAETSNCRYFLTLMYCDTSSPYSAFKTKTRHKTQVPNSLDRYLHPPEFGINMRMIHIYLKGNNNTISNVPTFTFTTIRSSAVIYRYYQFSALIRFPFIRYGREDEEVMGLKFCNEAIMSLAQIWPLHCLHDREPNTPLQVFSP